MFPQIIRGSRTVRPLRLRRRPENLHLLASTLRASATWSFIRGKFPGPRHVVRKLTSSCGLSYYMHQDLQPLLGSVWLRMTERSVINDRDLHRIHQ